MKIKISILIITIAVLYAFSFIGTANNKSQRLIQPLYTDVSATNLPLAVVSGPGMDVESADLDADGDKDIVIANEYQPNKLLFNNGYGVFTDATAGHLPQKYYDSEDIGIADMDLDGDKDIVFATEDHAIHELYFNNGNGVFSDLSNVLPNSIANSVLVFDINLDFYPDLIFGNAGPNDTPARNFILINNGDSTFTNETNSRLPNILDITQDIKLEDIDNDNDRDMIVGNEDGNKIYINDGTGVFTDETAARLPLTGTEETRKVTLADVDGDFDLDIFFANVAFRPGRVKQNRLLLNNGMGFFTDVTSLNLPFDDEHTTDGIFVDVDLDNDLDLITTNIFFNRPVKVFLNNGSGVFEDRTSEILPPNIVGEGIGIKAGYFNNDLLLDLYIVNRGQADKLLFRNDTASIGVNLNSNEVPVSYKLYQNYPNPFNPTTKIKFDVTDSPLKGGKGGDIVKLTIYDILGKEITTLVNQQLQPGTYEVEWDASNYPSGVYYYKLSTESFTETKKMVMLK